MTTKNWIDEAEAILRESRGVQSLRDVPLNSRTYLGIGGPARLFIIPDDPEGLGAVLMRFTEAGVPFDYLGAGSNLLVADAGPSFVVVSSEGFGAEPQIEGEAARVGSGYPVPRLVNRLAKAGLSGIEFAEGIPGCVGGAVRMNAGWHEGEFGRSVVSLTTVGRDGQVEELAARLGTFAYRSSPGLGDRFVAYATLRLTPETPARVDEKIRSFRDQRVRTQPTGARNAGCIFKNPPDNHAGRLIDACGLKGSRIGNAEVSAIHANFIINQGGATCADVATLIDTIRDVVFRKTGVQLEPEVVRWS